MNLAEKLVMRLIGALVPYASNSTDQDIFRAALMDYWDARDRDDNARQCGQRLVERPAQLLKARAVPQRAGHIIEDLGVEFLPA